MSAWICWEWNSACLHCHLGAKDRTCLHPPDNLGLHSFSINIDWSVRSLSQTQSTLTSYKAVQQLTSLFVATEIKSQLRMAASKLDFIFIYCDFYIYFLCYWFYLVVKFFGYPGSHRGIDSPQNYLSLSIFTLLFCFCPLGLIALIFSLKVLARIYTLQAPLLIKFTHLKPNFLNWHWSILNTVMHD